MNAGTVTPGAEVQRSVLAARIGALRADLDRVKDAWERLADGLTDAEQRERVDYLRSRVGAGQWFEKQFHPYRTAVREAGASIQADPSAMTLAAAWTEFGEMRRGLALILEEALLYVEGAAAIAAGVDMGVCRMSDDLLDEIARATGIAWPGTCIPAIRDETSQRTWIISIRYPDYRVWWLPIAVHELGHVAVGTLRNRTGSYPIPGRLAGTDRPAFLSEGAAVELFADLFATITLGPAYPAALLWRAIPTEAWGVPGGGHPGWALRMAVALSTLQERGIAGAAQIAEQWDAALTAVGQDIKRPAILEPLDVFRRQLVEEIDAAASGGSFGTMTDAVRLNEILLGQRRARPNERLVDHRTIVNAAWLSRIATRPPWMADEEQDTGVERTVTRWHLAQRASSEAGPT